MKNDSLNVQLTLSGTSLRRPPLKAGLAFDPSSGRGCAAEWFNIKPKP